MAICKNFLCKIWGWVSFGAAKASNPHKSSLPKIVLHKTFLPQKFSAIRYTHNCATSAKEDAFNYHKILVQPQTVTTYYSVAHLEHITKFNIHWRWPSARVKSSHTLPRCMNIWYSYEACTSPTLSSSSVLQCLVCSDALKYTTEVYPTRTAIHVSQERIRMGD